MLAKRFVHAQTGSYKGRKGKQVEKDDLCAEFHRKFPISHFGGRQIRGA
ncbi:hypothetical protein MAXJ12_35881 [Mesorhizobium alhagi CCNWXJ12-2]|uniref:Uncharacterized protein n=1 Tax=Mesorhizobium alhagi CCNWXJ12-2 TaxID=1107882 RepID=H0I3V9_9HYPH|nr:hypothetical protein MAXJ12_35881 [Mesorhizobium alhagi CCNWXJ12-2]